MRSAAEDEEEDVDVREEEMECERDRTTTSWGEDERVEEDRRRAFSSSASSSATRASRLCTCNFLRSLDACRDHGGRIRYQLSKLVTEMKTVVRASGNSPGRHVCS